MSTSTFEEEKTKLFDWKIILAVTIIYSLNSFILEGASALFPHEERIIIMVPAFASVAFGPVIGGLGTGFGNLLLDIFDKYILSSPPESLAPRHILGFFANMMGGAITGFYSRRIIMNPDDDIISTESIELIIRNTLASVLGLAIVTGCMIGFGRWLLTVAGIAERETAMEVGISIAGAIMTTNGMVLLIAMIPLQLVFMFTERRRAQNYRQQLFDSRTMRLLSSPVDPPIAVETFKGTGEGFVLRHWSTTELRLRNSLDVPMRYRVEAHSQDHLDPTVFYTEKMAPNGVDVVNLQLYPFDDANRKLRFVFRPWVDQKDILQNVFKKDQKFVYEYTYKVLMPGNRRFKVLASIIGIMALIVAVVRGLQSVLVGGAGTIPFIATIGIVIAEIVLVLIWYNIRKGQLGVD